MRQILVIEKNPMVRRGLGEVLVSAIEGVEVVEATDVASAAAILEAAGPPALALVSVDPPVRRAVAALTPLRRAAPSLPTAILSGGLDRRAVLHCLASGLVGAIDRDGSAADIVQAVRTLLDGRIHIPPAVGSAPADACDPHVALRGVLLSTPTAPPRPDPSKLTQRQREVLDLLVRGLSNREIGLRLGIAPSTAKIHVAGLLRALNVRNRTEAVTLVLDGGLLADLGGGPVTSA